MASIYDTQTTLQLILNKSTLDNTVNTIKNKFEGMKLDFSRGRGGGPQSVGGAIIFEFNIWLNLGMENEKFTGWEFDDWERAARIEKFYPIYRDKNGQFICHMSHARPTQDTPLRWYGACSPNKWGDLNRLWNMQQGPELDQYINELKELIDIKPIE